MNFTDYLWYFIIYSTAGWILDATVVSIQEKRFVNRGFLHGFYCPIYGFGMCAVIFALTPVRENLAALFLGGMVLTTALEYFTGWAMETLFLARWWDYSEHKFNVNGRICLSSSLAWGALSMLFVRFVHPFVQGLLAKLPQPAGMAALYVILAAMLADFTVSLVKAAGLSFNIRSLEELKNELQTQLGGRGWSLEELRSELQQRLDASAITERLGKLTSSYNHTAGHTLRKYSRFLNAFPNIIKSKMIGRLNEMKEDLNERFK